MWKCASRTIRATFHKSVLRCNTVLSTKVTQNKETNCLLRFAPSLIERINRFYGFYKTHENFSEERKDKEEPKRRNSFLKGFDVLKWGGFITIGTYLLAPFCQNIFSSKNNLYKNRSFQTLPEYQKTLLYLIDAAGIKPFNFVLPEVKAAKNGINEKQFSNSLSENTQSDKESFIDLEKAHQKVQGALNNFFGAHSIKSGNCKKALEYFMLSAEEGNAAGIFNLGICHEKGLGTSQNFNMAAELYQKAANLGHATAMYNLGVLYAQGLGGIDSDVDFARELFKKAASLGQRDAQNALNLEKQSFGETSEHTPLSQNSFQKKEETSSVIQPICDNEVHKSKKLPEIFNFEMKSVNCNDFEFSEKKLVDSILDSDSGVIDLSPHNKSDEFLI